MGNQRAKAMASVTIHSSSTIFPSRPTPNGVLPLSESDQLLGGSHVQTIYIFKPNDDASSLAVESLRNSLSEVLVAFYPLAGRVRWIGGGRFELDCCAAGARFIEASSSGKLDDYGDFRPTDAVKQLAPKVDYGTPVEELPLLMVQVTRFGCGGLSIGTAISHSEADGISAITFINAWASIARGEKTVDSILKPCHNRDLLQPRKPLNPPHFHHQEFDKPPLVIGRSNAEEERKKESSVALLKITKDQIEKLKKRANEANLKPADDERQPRPYSRYESVAGHMWVSACKARNTGESHQPTVVLIAVDIRRRLRSPLPEGFFGNAILLTVTPVCEFGDLMNNPLNYAAGKVREGTWKYTNDYVKSALNFLASQEEIGELRDSFKSVDHREAPFWGNPNLDLTCWISMPIYDADFGWGKPYYVGPAAMNVDGESFIIPSSADDGSLIIVTRLQTKHIDGFKKFFFEDL